MAIVGSIIEVLSGAYYTATMANVYISPAEHYYTLLAGDYTHCMNLYLLIFFTYIYKGTAVIKKKCPKISETFQELIITRIF